MRWRTASWNFAEGTGVYFSARLWVLSRISVEFGYGTEYIWRQARLKPSPVMILPSLHF